MHNSYKWQLFKSCIITKGFSRGIIIDTNRGKYFTVPLTLVSFLNELSTISFDSLLKKLSSTEAEIAEEYMSFLIDNDLIFQCPDSLIENFTEVSTDYDYPAHISNAVIEISDLSQYDLDFVLSQLSDLLCFNLVFVFKCKIDEVQLNQILNLLAKFEPDDVGLVLSNDLPVNFSDIKSRHNFLSSFIFSNSQTTPSSEYNSSLALNITYTNNDLANCKYCGVVDATFFTLGFPHYTESLHHNTCLNRKLAIDSEGYIKNCLSMKESFGNVLNTPLAEAVVQPEFKKYWNVKKDDITKCKDCEFRHVCTDCRAFVDNPEDIYSAPLKCGYDPYTNEWADWTTNPLKRNAIDYYGMHEIM